MEDSKHTNDALFAVPLEALLEETLSSLQQHSEQVVQVEVELDEIASTPFVDTIKRSDRDFIRKNLPEAAILTLTKDIITVVIMRTQYARVQLRCIYTDKYPLEPPIVELNSPSLPMPLLRNKEKESMDKAKENLNQPMIASIYEFIYDFIQTNLFIPCWKEMKQISNIIEGHGKIIRIDEKEGIIYIKIKQNNYYQDIKIIIPYMYPEEGIIIEFVASSFNYDIQTIFYAQTEELIRRCVAGYPPDFHQLLNTDLHKQPILQIKPHESTPKLTTGTLKNLKHDVNVLKQIADLRSINQSKDKRHQFISHSIEERREARKDLRRLAKLEAVADAEEVKILRDQEQEEMKQLMGLKLSETAVHSLLPAVTFLANEYVVRMANELCQACKNKILPENPSDEALTNPKSDLKPMRCFCGHWLHYTCLNVWLTTPPFARDCPVCAKRIYHPDWPSDIKALERAWQNQEARKREMSDISDMMGF